jgi:hypothetical protein
MKFAAGMPPSIPCVLRNLFQLKKPDSRHFVNGGFALFEV